MRYVFLMLFSGMLAAPSFAETLGSETLPSFDAGFFGANDNAPAGNQVQRFDPQFFDNRQPDPNNPNSPQNWRCTAVWADSPAAESTRLSAVAAAKCATAPTFKWIATPPNPWGNNPARGYYQVCCFQKVSPSARSGRQQR